VNFQSLARSTAAVCAGFALVFLVPALVAIGYGENWTAFGYPMAALAVVGAVGALSGFRTHEPLGPREGVIVVVLTWIIACLTGAIPFMLSGTVSGFADALFESSSG